MAVSCFGMWRRSLTGLLCLFMHFLVFLPSLSSNGFWLVDNIYGTRGVAKDFDSREFVIDRRRVVLGTGQEDDAEGTIVLEGPGGLLPREILKSRLSELRFPRFSGVN